MNLNSLKTDPTLDEGVWLKLGDGEFKIARLGGPQYQSAAAKRLKPHRESLEMGVLSDSDARRIQIELLADFILVGWKNVQFDGQDAPYSRENAIKALEIDAFRHWVSDQAGTLENFRAKEMADAAAAVGKN